MSTTSVSTEDVLRSFDLLSEPEKQQVAAKILRQMYASPAPVDDAQLAALYAEFSEADRRLAEEGIEDYGKGLVSEDAE